MREPRQIASGLRLPEGPTLLADGRIAFVELYVAQGAWVGSATGSTADDA